MKRKVFVISILLIVVCFLPLFGGGGRQQQGNAAVQASYPTGRISYPMQTDVTLTWWTGIASDLSQNYTSYNDVPSFIGWQERTGIKISFLHPPTGGGDEQLNLIIASGDLPDIFNYNFISYPGGPEKAISDGVILRLNDLINNYAPNLKNVYSANPQYDRMVKTDTGSYYSFPFIRNDPRNSLYQGLQIRKDWLDELGLAPPETYDEWHNVLTIFKTKKNSPAPLAIPYGNTSFMYGYGIDSGFYLGNDGRVLWGRVQPAYKDYLAMMAQWYKEGLLDPDTATLTTQQIAAKITNGTAGAAHGTVSGNMGTWIPSGRSVDPRFELRAVSYPVHTKGDRPFLINIDNVFYGDGVSPSGTTKYPEIAARFLDWGYSDEGYMYHNFGTLGFSYNMVNGIPTYTDYVFKNPKGWSVAQAIASIAMGKYSGPLLQSFEFYYQQLIYPEQVAALDIWSIDDPFKYKLPTLTPTPDESQEIAAIMSEVNTYATEMMVRFILGTEPLSNFDNYVNTVRRMGIDRAVEIYNAAVIRYNNR